MNLSSTLRSAIESGDAVIRIRADLEPASGDKILPPTYTGSAHNMTPPREDGSSEWCSVDSPASFANRVEAALREAHPELAPLRVKVGDRTISTLEMPHRAFDATLRESHLDGTPWVDTDIAKAIGASSFGNAYALLKYDPAMILLGGWDSTKLGKRAQTREAKSPAALSCEITAADVLPVSRAGSRIDPLGIEGTEASLVEHEDGRLEPYNEDVHGRLPVRGDRDTGVYPRRVKPSQVNLGNVAPSLIPKGVLVRGGITLNGVIDLRRLSRYKFAPADDVEARLLLALTGLFGVNSVLRQGLDLRRDCELVATGASFELLRFGGAREPMDLKDIGDALAAQIAVMGEHISPPVTLEGNAALSSLVGAA